MKSVSPAYAALIDAGDNEDVFIWKVKRRDGNIEAYTEHDLELAVDLGDGDGAVTFSPGTITDPTEYKQSAGTSIDNAELEGASGQIDGLGVTRDSINAGLYDGAEITTALTHWPDSSVGGMILSVQYAGDVVTRDQVWNIAARSLISVLNTRVSIKIQPECRHEFGGAACKYDLTGQIFDGVISSQVDARRYVTDVIQVESYFAFGKVEFLSGRNTGTVYDITESDAAGEIALYGPPMLPVDDGDNIRLTRGCAHSTDACKGFNNFVNYGGFPHVPGSKVRNQRGTR